jgi:cell shape-determining protein MreC
MKRKSLNNIIIICIVLALLTLANTWFNLDFGGKITFVAKPVGMVFTQLGANIWGIFSNVKNIGRLQKENSELNEKLNSALTEIAKLNEAQKENSALKRDLGFKDENNYQLVSA